MLRAGNNRVGLSQDDWKKGRDRKKGVGMRVFIATTQNVDESRDARNAPASSSTPIRTIPSAAPPLGSNKASHPACAEWLAVPER